MDKKIRWGILSTANIGRKAVIPAIHHAHNSEVVAVASRDFERARAFAHELNIPTAYGTYEELLADPTIDAIYNPLPNEGHAPWSMRAAEAGKAVLCEKPLTVDAAEARRMVDFFKSRGVQLAEAFMYRFHPQTQYVKSLVDSGAVGKVQSIYSAFTFQVRRADDIRLSKALAGGSIMDVGCYCVNIMRLITGEEPANVSAFGEFNDDGVDVRAAGVVAFPSGVLGHFDCGMTTYRAHLYEIRGTEGRIRVDEAFTPPKDRITMVRHWQGERVRELEIPPADQYELMVEDFADALLNDRAPRFAAEDAVHGMAVLDRLRASAEQNPVARIER